MQYNTSIDDFYKYYCTYYLKSDESNLPFEPFDDCDNYYVTLARATGLVLGVGNNFFEPDRAITREEAAVLLVNVYRVYSADLYAESSVLTDVAETVYADDAEISDWAKDSVALLGEWKTMIGVGENKFNPDGFFSREQCIATFMRLYNDAPVSRRDGVSLCPYTYDELAEDVRNMWNYTETQFLENDLCGVLLGYQSGVPHGSSDILTALYKNGGSLNIKLLLWDVTHIIVSIELDGNTLAVTAWNLNGSEKEVSHIDLSARTYE